MRRDDPSGRRASPLANGETAQRTGDGVKRVLDFALGLLGLVIAAPIMALVAVAIRVTMGSPVLFRQIRPGRDGRPFELIKLRTMLEQERGQQLPDEVRITRLGAFLRRMSIDELPEFWNVVKGEMSLVGPRPLLLEYVDRFTPDQARRMEVRPGVTGLAQVNGRNALDWEDRLALDVWYVENWTLWLDVKILAVTLRQVLLGTGVSAPGHATSPEFKGRGEG